MCFMRERMHRFRKEVLWIPETRFVIVHVGSPHRFNPGAEDAPVGETSLCIPQTAGEAADYSLLAKRVR